MQSLVSVEETKEDEEIQDTAYNNEATSSAYNRLIYSLQYTRNYPRTPWRSFVHSIMHEHSYLFATSKMRRELSPKIPLQPFLQ